MTVSVDHSRMDSWLRRQEEQARAWQENSFDLAGLRPGFVGHRLFWSNFTDFYTCFIAGGLGKGKTLLAFALAHLLVWEGYVDRVFSNIPSLLTDQVSAPVVDACVIFDESWITLDSREWSGGQANTYGAFLRKTNTYMVFPSRITIDKRFREFWVQRVFNAWVFGVPLWVYEWRLESGMTRERGRFGLWRPERYFGLYDTAARPAGDGGISEALKLTNPVLDEFEKSAKQFTGDMQDMVDVSQSDAFHRVMSDSRKKKRKW